MKLFHTRISKHIVLFGLYGFVQTLLYLSLFKYPFHKSPQSTSLFFFIILCLLWLFFNLSAEIVKKQGVNQNQLIFILIVTALIYRLIAFFAPVVESSDYLRYLFDGKLLTEGLNPYDVAPNNFPEFGGLKLEKPEMKTIYPPFAELLFFLSVSISPHIFVWKSLCLTADLLSVFLLYRLLKHMHIKTTHLFFYLWNPLILKEFINSAHLEIFSCLFALLAVSFLVQSKKNQAIFSIVCAMYIKLIPVILLIPFLKKLNGFQYIYILASIVCLLVVLPYQSLTMFYQGMDGFGIVFNVLKLVFSTDFSRSFSNGIGFAISVWIVISQKKFLKQPVRLMELMLIYFLFSHTAFPWYMVYLIPLFIIRQLQTAWFAFGMFHCAYYSFTLGFWNFFLLPLVCLCIYSYKKDQW